MADMYNLPYRGKKRDERQSFHVKQRTDRPAGSRPAHSAANRTDEGTKSSTTQQVIYGLRPVIEAIDAGRQIDRIYLQKGLEGALVSELKAKLTQTPLPVQYVPVEKLNRLVQGNHQGVVATISPVEYHTFVDELTRIQEEGRTPFFVLLDHITDVRNMGAIVRTAECVGVDAIIVPDHGSAQLNEDAVKTSSGALLRLPICRESNLKTVINLAKQSGVQVVAATEKGATDYLSVDYRQPLLLVMGSEDTGITSEILKICDLRAKLPILGNVQSLNVSVAAAVFMYEVLRQRR